MGSKYESAFEGTCRVKLGVKMKIINIVGRVVNIVETCYKKYK